VVSILVQSLYFQLERVLATVENCGPLGGCTTETRADTAAAEALREAKPLSRFTGLGTNTDRNHLAFKEVGAILRANQGMGNTLMRLYKLPFN
jgi:multiple sugar transport system permease protein